jgi:hypothetical protein
MVGMYDEAVSFAKPTNCPRIKRERERERENEV